MQIVPIIIIKTCRDGASVDQSKLKVNEVWSTYARYELSFRDHGVTELLALRFGTRSQTVPCLPGKVVHRL